jgi:hypothetical protein
MFNFLHDFFFEHEPTVDDAFRKADNVGWNIEETEAGYTVNGVNADGEAASWQFGGGETADMNYLLDHANSCAMGDEYRRQKWGLEPGEIDTSDEWCERKHEIREYRTEAYYEQEYKPGWRRLLGL